jgi:hypothetical protein
MRTERGWQYEWPTYLGIRKKVQGLLVSRVSLLQVILHEITVPYMA